MDDGLRSAIDGLIARGGRLVVRPPDAAAPALTLDQPGGRFGILEVHGRLAVDAADRERMAALIDAGWSDPSVTRRGDREIRIRPVGVDGGQVEDGSEVYPVADESDDLGLHRIVDLGT